MNSHDYEFKTLDLSPVWEKIRKYVDDPEYTHSQLNRAVFGSREEHPDGEHIVEIGNDLRGMATRATHEWYRCGVGTALDAPYIHLDVSIERYDHGFMDAADVDPQILREAAKKQTPYGLTLSDWYVRVTGLNRLGSDLITQIGLPLALFSSELMLSAAIMRYALSSAKKRAADALSCVSGSIIGRRLFMEAVVELTADEDKRVATQRTGCEPAVVDITPNWKCSCERFTYDVDENTVLHGEPEENQ